MEQIDRKEAKIFDWPCPFCGVNISEHNENLPCFAAMGFLCHGYWAGMMRVPEPEINQDDIDNGFAEEIMADYTKQWPDPIWGASDNGAGFHWVEIKGQEYNVVDRVLPIMEEFMNGDLCWQVCGIGGKVDVWIPTHTIMLKNQFLVSGFVRAWILWKVAAFLYTVQ